MSPSTTTAGLIKNRRLLTPPKVTPSVQRSSRTPTPSYPPKLPGIVCAKQDKHGKTEAAQPIYPFDDLYEEDASFVENFLESPGLHSNTNTPAILRARSNSVTINCSNSASRSPSAPKAPTSCPSHFVPTWTLPEDTDFTTNANFVACRHTRSDPCLAHSGIVPCDCEAVQRPTMGQNEAWTVMSRRFKAVQEAWRNELPPLRVPRAPLSTGAPQERRPQRSSSSPLGDRHAPILAHAPARRSCPAVLAVPSRVVAHAHAAVARDRGTASRLSRLGGALNARDTIERRRSNPKDTERVALRVPSVHRHRGV